MKLDPVAPITEEGASQFRTSSLAIVGRRLFRVRYRNAPGASSLDRTAIEGVHEVDMDVVIVFDDATAGILSWAMDGLIEGLGVRIEDQIAATIHEDESDVSLTPEWRQLIGKKVEAVGAAWHVPNAGCPNTLWAVRLSLTGGSSVTVALGETDDHSVRYQPDALVVLFDAARARGYQPPASHDSAFGHTIAP